MEPLSSLNPQARRSALLLASYGFGSAAAYVLARTIADSAFLSHIGPERLPLVYMVSAVAVGGSSLLYARAVQRWRLRRVIRGTLLLLAASSAGLPLIMQRFSDSLLVFGGIYLLAQIRGSLGTIQYATLLNEQFAQDETEQVVGLVGVGATLAGITTGVALGIVAQHVHVESLMYVAALIDVATIVPVFWLPRASAGREASLFPAAAPAADFRIRDAGRVPLVLGIAGAVTASVLAATLVEYQWKVTAASVLHRDEEALARYFGYFYGSLYLLTGILQIFVTGSLLRRRGPLIGLLTFPLALLVASCAAWAATAERLLLSAFTLAKGCDTLKRSLHEPAVQVLYNPLQQHLRRQAIAFVAGIAKPFAEALAAVLLVAATPWLSPRQLSAVVVAVIAIWLAFNWQVWQQFRRQHQPSVGEPEPHA